jgi:hypothetical protein
MKPKTISFALGRKGSGKEGVKKDRFERLSPFFNDFWPKYWDTMAGIAAGWRIFLFLQTELPIARVKSQIREI